MRNMIASDNRLTNDDSYTILLTVENKSLIRSYGDNEKHLKHIKVWNTILIPFKMDFFWK